MAEFKPRFRARLLLANGSVLTPRSGSRHSDAFQVTSEPPGVTGWKPYIIDAPNGPTNALDRLTGRTSISDFELHLQDARIGASNTERWITEFFGDALGVIRPHGLTLEVTRQLTAGGPFDPFWAGPVSQITVPDPGQDGAVVRLRGRDARIHERRRIFVGAPHPAVADYAQPSPLCPIGAFLEPWGGMIAAQPVSNLEMYPHPAGTVRTAVDGGMVTIEVTRPNGDRTEGGKELGLTSELAARADLVEESAAIASTRYCPQIRVRVTRLDTDEAGDFFLCPTNTPIALEGQRVVGNYQPYDGRGRNGRAPLWVRTNGRVAAFGITPIPSGMDQAAHPLKHMALPPAGTRVRWVIYNAGLPTEGAPTLIGDVHPARLTADMAAGYFGALNDSGREHEPNDGAVAFPPLPVDDDAFDDAAGWQSERLRFAIDRVWKMEDFQREQVTRVVHIAAVTNRAGLLVPRDLRLSEVDVSSLATITAEDIVRADWEHGQDVVGSVAVVTYSDTSIFNRDFGDFGGFADSGMYEIPASGLETSSRSVPFFTQKGIDPTAREEVVDALGVRHGVRFPNASDPLLRHAREQLVFGPYDQIYGTGAAKLTLLCRHTSVTADLLPGTWLLVDVAGPPDPATNTRHGVRLMMVESERPDPFGPHVHLKLLDAGPHAVCVAPSLGTLSISGSPPDEAISQPVTLNAVGDAAEVWVATTDTGVMTRPADNSSLWELVKVLPASETVVIPGLAPGRKFWLRARSVATQKVASGWVYPTPASVESTAFPTIIEFRAESQEDNSVLLLWDTIFTAGMRIEYAFHDAGGPPETFGTSVDVDADDGQFVIPAAGSAPYLTIIATPYSGWDDEEEEVTGSAGLEARRTVAVGIRPGLSDVTVSITARAEGGQLWVTVVSESPGVQRVQAWARRGASPVGADGEPLHEYLIIDRPSTGAEDATSADDGTWHIAARGIDADGVPGQIAEMSIDVTDGGGNPGGYPIEVGSVSNVVLTRLSSPFRHRLTWTYTPDVGSPVPPAELIRIELSFNEGPFLELAGNVDVEDEEWTFAHPECSPGDTFCEYAKFTYRLTHLTTGLAEIRRFSRTRFDYTVVPA